MTRKIRGFALLRRGETDTFEEHKDPWIIELVYTVPSYRGQGIALQLLEKVRLLHPELTALCVSDAGHALFTRASFTRLDMAPFAEGWEATGCPSSFATFSTVVVMRFP